MSRLSEKKCEISQRKHETVTVVFVKVRFVEKQKKHGKQTNKQVGPSVLLAKYKNFKKNF